MTDAKKTRRYQAEALILEGKLTPEQIGEQLNIPAITVRSWKKKLEKENTDVNTIVEVEPTVLHEIAEKIKENAPAKVCKDVDNIVESVTSLKTLEPKFHAVVLNLLKRAETLSQDENLSVKDWQALSNGIGNLYSNIFNKAGVNVSVLNQTQVNSEKLSMFKTTLRNS